MCSSVAWLLCNRFFLKHYLPARNPVNPGQSFCPAAVRGTTKGLFHRIRLSAWTVAVVHEGRSSF